MAISFDKALGIHEAALRVRTQRAEVLASNLANVETPGYQARDIDFREVLQAQRGGSSLPMQEGGQRQPLEQGMTHHNHIPLKGFDRRYAAEPEVKFTQPHQASLDGNTVEAHEEHAKFMQNAMDFQASFTLLNRKFSGLSKALKGE
ncbi:MAG TPA: flagellar basal body rod protein FlgB [Pseudomonadales bacterium]|nr:flagellar basal body rod protein FlgB [Pseudomonadales bacterium]